MVSDSHDNGSILFYGEVIVHIDQGQFAHSILHRKQNDNNPENRFSKLRKQFLQGSDSSADYLSSAKSLRHGPQLLTINPKSDLFQLLPVAIHINMILVVYTIVVLNAVLCVGQLTTVDRHLQKQCCSKEKMDKLETSINSIMTTLQNMQTMLEDLNGRTDKARDCYDLKLRGITASGVYTITLDWITQVEVKVYCDMDTDSGGWTVFQRRQDGRVDFYLYWDDYKTGFGNLDGEFWLGNDNIYRLTNQGRQYELRVDLEDFENETRYAVYDRFSISDETDNYRLDIGSYSGDAGDSLSGHQEMQFTTRDMDNDRRSTINCATLCTGAWWYNNCHYANLNGQYLGTESTAEYATGVVWSEWKGFVYSLKHTEMKIRPLM
ncbi:microfibril-associated glycoprotein 4-like [Glandiceps talaboti]